MDLRQTIHIRPELQLRLKLTMELQQAIKLLQLNRLELLNLVQQELSENPVLEETPVAEAEEAPAQAPEPTAQEQQVIPEDDEWKKTLQDYRDSGPLPGTGRSSRAEDLPAVDATLSEREDLYDHLLWQLRMARLTARERLIGGELIGNLADNGDLAAGVMESIAERLAVSLEEVNGVRKIIQRFDPIGVASLSLEDCLLVQAEVYFPGDELVHTIIRHHLPDLVGRNVLTLGRKLGVSDEDIEDAREIITSLDPKPGRAFAGENPHYVEPDVFVERAGEGYLVLLNEDGLPKLRLSSYYTGLLGTRIKKDTREYLKKKVRSAEWFMKSIHQRQHTVQAVAESIVRFQKEFLDHGVQRLKPLVLQEVAEDIRMHQSTVSRVTTNKYMHTPQGLFPMKFFFNPRIESSSGGEDLSSQAVKDQIRRLVAAEDARTPLSDQQIVERLSTDGTKLARRTVAKYREQLGILSSSKRVRPV
jgi:RNA polymerase sigma-54 factor